MVHGAREQTFRLRIHDPKFREPRGGQDRLVFSADREGTLYTIEGATRKEPQTYWEVTLKAESAVLCRKFPAVPQPTQVVVYRMPTLHSDLFGFGALAYDLVSGGKSAERFYEQLRSVDYTDSRHTVDSLVEKYSKRHRSLFPRSSERELNEIFSSFRDGEDMCPPEFVDLILRCMCHRVKDAFVTQTEDAFRSILNKLKELDATFRSKEDTPNLLIAPEKAPEWSLVQERLLEDTLKSA